jgi:hypothetical protein
VHLLRPVRPLHKLDAGHKRTDIFAQDRIDAALSELEHALGKEISFENNLSVDNDFIQSLIESGAATFEPSDEPFFKWNPPLPNSDK